jgi:hypothetical protein
MSSEQAPKSAYDLAMARLRQKDADAGIVDHPLTEAQREAIAEVRRICEAKTAEAQILHRSRTAGAIDPAVLLAAEEEVRRDIQRLRDDAERKVAKIRAGS